MDRLSNLLFVYSPASLTECSLLRKRPYKFDQGPFFPFLTIPLAVTPTIYLNENSCSLNKKGKKENVFRVLHKVFYKRNGGTFHLSQIETELVLETSLRLNVFQDGAELLVFKTTFQTVKKKGNDHLTV